MECLLCLETVSEADVDSCPQCQKLWCAECNNKWVYQQKYNMQVQLKCPFCRAALVDDDVEPLTRENGTFMDNIVSWILSVFVLGLLVVLLVIEIVAAKNAEIMYAYVATLIIVLFLAVVQGLLVQYTRSSTDNSYLEQEDDDYAV